MVPAGLAKANHSLLRSMPHLLQAGHWPATISEAAAAAWQALHHTLAHQHHP